MTTNKCILTVGEHYTTKQPRKDRTPISIKVLVRNRSRLTPDLIHVVNLTA